ncbi:hypothetical protein Ddye_021882 [Dipteronia dyeriana]|uniref:Secreted protein n=1 Tax=Dipteronia dyeriana TaxID=168575 RepID=A0AAD9U2K4_9ROSI|nr:hypothetical protein Ddye_021882 [Dipteronia dyeriana]
MAPSRPLPICGWVLFLSSLGITPLAERLGYARATGFLHWGHRVYLNGIYSWMAFKCYVWKCNRTNYISVEK